VLRAFRILLALACALFAVPVMARDDGRYANSPLKDWVRGLKDKMGVGCCDTSDGFPAEVEWDTQASRYRVRIEGVWYVVPESAVLTEPNKLGYPMVWYWMKTDVPGGKPIPQIRCFLPGAGG
jgi:hypothetical protein